MKNTKIKMQISFTKVCRLFATASLAVFLVLFYFFISPIKNNNTNSAFAEGVSDTPATSGEPVDSLINLSLTHPSVSLELTPLSTDGTFSSSSEPDNAAFSVSTNNFTGYTLYISSSSDDGYLSSVSTGATADNSLSSIDEVTEESDFSDVSSTELNNKWGYKPSKYNSEANTSYLPAPTTTPSPLDTTSTYDTTKEGEAITSTTNIDDINTNTYTIGLGARVDYTRPTGSYSSAFTLSVLGNPVPVTLSYTDTSGDNTVTSTLPSTYNGSVSETRVPISTTIPERTGYTFKSWCAGTVEAGTESTNYLDTCTGTVYNASNPTEGTQYVGIDRTKSNAITLTAMWQRNKYLQTVQTRYQGTDGNYGDYADYSTCTAEVYYGDTHSCDIAATTEYKAASLASYTVTSTNTKQITVDRQKYTQTIQARYQDTSGNYGSYSTYAACTADVFYGATHSCSYTATTEYKAASVASYTVTGANTKQMDVARQTYTQTIQVRYQNTSGGWGSYSNYSSCTKAVYYGATHSCSISATTEYKAASVASYTVTGATTKQMDVARQTYTQTVQIRYQNASGGWGSYSNYSSCTKAVYYGATHSCSVAASTTYAATSVSSYTVTGTNTKQMSASRNTRTVTLSKGTGVSSVSITGTGVKSGSGTASATVYYDGTVTIAATMSSGYDWVNWTGSATYTNSSQSISNITSNKSFTANGKVGCAGKVLADGNCWVMVEASLTWPNASQASQCPSGFSVAVRQQVRALVDSYSGGGLHSALGLSGNIKKFWSDTTDTNSTAYQLVVTTISAYVESVSRSTQGGTACIKN